MGIYEIDDDIIEQFFEQCKEFSTVRLEKTNKKQTGFIDIGFISQMIRDEIHDEFSKAVEKNDLTEQVDGILDAVYYILEHIATSGIPVDDIIQYYVENDFTVARGIMVLIDENYVMFRVNHTLRQLSIMHSAFGTIGADENDLNDKDHIIPTLLNLVQYLLKYLAECGINFVPIWNLIHSANMSKFTLPGGYQREDGKWMKPPGFTPPDDDIRKEMKKQFPGIPEN